MKIDRILQYIQKPNRYEVLMAICVVVLGYIAGGFLWLIPVIGWFTLCLFSPRANRKVQLLCISYPLVESFIKLLINNNVIPYSWAFLNRVEHLLFSMCLTALLWYVLRLDQQVKMKNAYKWLIIVGFVVIFGNINEFWEAFLRIQYINPDLTRQSVYYWDTIVDMVMNLIGASVVATVVALHSRSSTHS